MSAYLDTYNEYMAHARATISDATELAVEERRIRALATGNLLFSMQVPIGSDVVGFVQKMRLPFAQGAHRAVMSFSQPLEGWIDREAFDLLWLEQSETLMSTQRTALTVAVKPLGDMTAAELESATPGLVLARCISDAYEPVRVRLADLMIGWTMWDGAEPLDAPEGTVNPGMARAAAAGPDEVARWRETAAEAFDKRFRAELDRMVRLANRYRAGYDAKRRAQLGFLGRLRDWFSTRR